MQFLEKLWKKRENSDIKLVAIGRRRNFSARIFFAEKLLAIEMKKKTDTYG